MENNCKVTKYKKSTGNSNLSLYGMACITVVPEENPTSTNRACLVAFTKPTTLIIEGDGYFTDETLTQNLGKTMSYTSIVGGGLTVYLSNNATYKLYIDKYKVKMLNTRAASHGKIVNFNDFDYADSIDDLETPGNWNSEGSVDEVFKKNNLVFFNGSNTKVGLNLANAAGCTLLQKLECGVDFNNIGERGKNVTGSIESLVNCTALISLNLNSQINVNGVLETLLAGMCANRTSGTLVYNGFKTQCTFHDTLDLISLYCTFSNDGVVVKQNSQSGTLLGTYTKATSTWTYPE